MIKKALSKQPKGMGIIKMKLSSESKTEPQFSVSSLYHILTIQILIVSTAPNTSERNQQAETIISWEASRFDQIDH